MFTRSGKRKTFSRKVWKTMRSFSWIFQTSDILCCKKQIRWECLLNFFKCIDFFIIVSRRLLIPFPKMDTKLLLILLRNYNGCIYGRWYWFDWSFLLNGGCWAIIWTKNIILAIIKSARFWCVFYIEWIYIYICYHNLVFTT